MYRKRKKLSHDPVSTNNSDKPSTSFNLYTNLPKSRFCTLPAEILELIFYYLDPEDLVSIEQLDIERLTDISLSCKCADFSSCNTVLTEDVSSFFSRNRVNYIQEINFNNVFFVKNAVLERCITKCKHLKRLSVYECGLTCTNVIDILERCTELEELYWTVFKGSSHKKIKDDAVYKLKKLYLNVQKSVLGSFTIACDLLEKCSFAVEVCINMSPYFTMSLPPRISRRTFVCKLTRFTHYPINIVVRSKESVCKAIMDELLTVNDAGFDPADEERREENPSSFFTYHSPYLQVLTELEDLNAISTLPIESVHSLVLILTDMRLFLQNHLNMLKQVTGKRLRSLVVHNTTYPSAPENPDEVIDVPEADFLSDMISQMPLACINIQVLDISEIHFDGSLPFSSLSCLKQLKILSLPACALKEQHSTSVSQVKEFEGLIANCKKVERFSLYGCLYCRMGPTDNAMLSVSKWKMLTDVVISKVCTLRTCQFLSRIADSCPGFASLELNAVGDLSICHYTQHVLTVLRKCKKFMFLRINQKAFFPASSYFWKSIELAKNLQGLCLATDLETSVDNKMVVESIKKLPILHLFHLYGRRLCQNLSAQVKQTMNKKGVRVPKIEIIHLESSNNDYLECTVNHFPVM